MDPAAAELELRLRAEELVALATSAPVAEVMAELDAFEAAASALEGCGTLPAERSTVLVAEVVDALVVRGAVWLAPVVPELDVARLYEAAAGGRLPLLRRVVPVVATLGSATVTTVELWSDRAVARMVSGDQVVASHVVGAAGAGDRRLELRDPAGGVVGVDLTGGCPAREARGRVERASTRAHLDALVASAIADARRESGVEGLNRSRARLRSAARAVAPEAETRLLERFDAGVAAGDGPSTAPALLDVVPVAQRFLGGWLLSIELWSDHWRAVVVEEDPTSRGWWTASDDRGASFGGAAIDREVVRFDPALPMGWATLRLERHRGPDVLAVDLAR